jgi:hypothetical protein
MKHEDVIKKIDWEASNKYYGKKSPHLMKTILAEKHVSFVRPRNKKFAVRYIFPISRVCHWRTVPTILLFIVPHLKRCVENWKCSKMWKVRLLLKVGREKKVQISMDPILNKRREKFPGYIREKFAKPQPGELRQVFQQTLRTNNGRC